MSDPPPISLPILTEHIRRLVNGLSTIRECQPRNGAADPPSWRWDDDDYIYLEVALEVVPDVDADISITQGRAVIRIGR